MRKPFLGLPIRGQKATRSLHFFYFLFSEEAGTRKLLRSHTMLCMSLIPSRLHTTEALRLPRWRAFFEAAADVVDDLTDGRHDVGDDWAVWRWPKSKRNINLWRLVGRPPARYTNSGKTPKYYCK